MKHLFLPMKLGSEFRAQRIRGRETHVLHAEGVADFLWAPIPLKKMGATIEIYPGSNQQMQVIQLIAVPAEAMPLLVIGLFQNLHGSRPVPVRTDRKQDVDEAHRGGIGIANEGFNHREKALIGEPRNR